MTLIILAAGMGSRYGSLKQIDAIGPNEETIIDYTLYDANRAGFDKVVFVIRTHFRETFEKKIAEKWKPFFDIDFALQPLQLPQSPKTTRTKPWGTSHALLVAAAHTDEPFAVVNADDFYGADSFHKVAGFLKRQRFDSS